jgi:voltage-gated potassium channel
VGTEAGIGRCCIRLISVRARLFWHHPGMDAVSQPNLQRGRPRSSSDAAVLHRFDTLMQLPIAASAILPLLIVPGSNGWVGVVIGVLSWVVFLVDYVVQARHLVHYGRTRLGRFDLFVVIATAPWFLIPGVQAGQFVVVLRLARLARLLMVTRGARRLFARLGRVAAIAGGVVVLGSLVAYHAEHPTNSEFATIGDALWWGIVTLTTVGYGDIVPETTPGRWASILIMITGIAVLGMLAGSLASFFRLDEEKPAPTADETPGSVTVSSDAALLALAGEVSALQRQVAQMTTQLARLHPELAAHPTADEAPDPAG